MKIHGSNGIIDLDDIEPVDIELKDIAASLSRQARFNGNGRKKISVAQHCIAGATALAGNTGNYLAALWFLLHDAHEAYTGDIITPMKNKIVDHCRCDPVGDMQDRLDNAISRRLFFDFDLDTLRSTNWYQSVKDMDKFLAEYEASQLFSYVEKPVNPNRACALATRIYRGDEISLALTAPTSYVPQYVKDLVWRQRADLVLTHQSLKMRNLLTLGDRQAADLYVNLYHALYAAAAIQLSEEE